MTNNPIIPNPTPIDRIRIALTDYAFALTYRSDSSIDDAQLELDALLDMIPADMRDDPDYDDLPAAINRDALDDLDRDAYDALRDATIALFNSRP